MQAGGVQLLEHCLRCSSQQLWSSHRPHTPGRTSAVGRTSDAGRTPERSSIGCQSLGRSQHPSKLPATPQQCCLAGAGRTSFKSRNVGACLPSVCSTPHCTILRDSVLFWGVRHNMARVCPTLCDRCCCIACLSEAAGPSRGCGQSSVLYKLLLIALTVIAVLSRVAAVFCSSARTVESGWICKAQIMPLSGPTGIWPPRCPPLKQPLPFPLATCSQVLHAHGHINMLPLRAIHTETCVQSQSCQAGLKRA